MSVLQVPVSNGFVPPFDPLEDPIKNEFILETGFKIYQLQTKITYLMSKLNAQLKDLEEKEKNDKENAALRAEIKTLKEKSLELQQIHEKEKERIIDDAHKHHDNLLNKIREIKDNNMDEVQKKELYHHNNLTKAKEDFNISVKKLEEEFQIKSKSIQTQYENEIAEMKKINTNLQDKILNSTSATNDLVTQLKNASDERERKMQELCNEKQKTIDKLTNEMLTITASITKRTSAATIGIVGEEMIEQWVSELFNSAEIVNLTGQTSRGDLHVKIGSKTFLLEIKNKTVIHKGDIDKFINDVNNNKTNIHGALFVTLNTPAIPHKGDLSLEYIADIPVIYCYINDKQTLRVAMKTLMFLNNKADAGLLTMLVNELYTKISSLSLSLTTLEKNAIDNRSIVETMKKDIKQAIMSLDNLFEEHPDLKVEKSTQLLEYSPDEIKILRETYTLNKKAKMEDYVRSLNVTLKYLQDRGGAAKIKSIVTTISSTKTTLIKPEEIPEIFF